jgi:hypothetical protein
LLVTRRLLVVSPRFLFPLDQGGRIRTANTLRNMKGGAFQITLVSPAPPDARRWDAEIATVCDEFRSWPEESLSRAGKIAALFGKLPVAVASDVSRAGRRVVAQALAEKPDAVLVDFPHAAVLMPSAMPPRSIMFTHNVEAEIFERQVELTRPPMRWVWQHEARKMRRFEGDVLRTFGTVIAVSERDAHALESQYQIPKVHPVKTGVDIDYYSWVRPDSVTPPPPDGGILVFTGAMDSRSNIEGIQFLLREVWPLILAARPKAQALIVGRNPPANLKAEAASRNYDWSFSGYVDDVRPWVARGHAYAIPLRVGSGTRLKVFEAMAMGTPMVSTGLGVEGLPVEPGEHYLRANDARSFADATLALFADGDRRQALSTAARALVEARFSWPAVTGEFESICLAAAQRR